MSNTSLLALTRDILVWRLNSANRSDSFAACAVVFAFAFTLWLSYTVSTSPGTKASFRVTVETMTGPAEGIEYVTPSVAI